MFWAVETKQSAYYTVWLFLETIHTDYYFRTVVVKLMKLEDKYILILCRRHAALILNRWYL